MENNGEVRFVIADAMPRGALIWGHDCVFRFEGDAEESAKLFLEQLNRQAALSRSVVSKEEISEVVECWSKENDEDFALPPSLLERIQALQLRSREVVSVGEIDSVLRSYGLANVQEKGGPTLAEEIQALQLRKHQEAPCDERQGASGPA